MKHFLPVLFLAAALSACGSAPNFSAPDVFAADDENAPSILRAAKGENVELILHPVPVWDEFGASSSAITIESDGGKYAARPRKTGFLEKPYARAGLFWNSRLEYVLLPIVIVGPPADIRGAEIQAGANRAILRRADDNFTFTPARQSGEDGRISSAVFQMKIKTLRAIAAADTAQIVVNTSRGVLKLGLDVAADNSSPSDYRRNARALFAQFSAKIAAEQRTNG